MTDDKTNPTQGPTHTSSLAELSSLNSKELVLALKKMNIGQKKVLALKGNVAMRKMLLRDPSVEVQLAVINSPKTTESEIERHAGLASTAEIVLKTISNNSRWMKSYRIKHALAKNPKTPIGIASRCLRSLTKHDVKKISTDPNVRKPLAQTAQRMLRSRR